MTAMPRTELNEKLNFSKISGKNRMKNIHRKDFPSYSVFPVFFPCSLYVTAKMTISSIFHQIHQIYTLFLLGTGWICKN